MAKRQELFEYDIEHCWWGLKELETGFLGCARPSDAEGLDCASITAFRTKQDAEKYRDKRGLKQTHTVAIYTHFEVNP